MRSKIESLVLAATLAAGVVLLPSCAVTRGQESVGEYASDSAITAALKSKFAADPEVSAMAIQVETMQGAVQLSGFAKSEAERAKAGTIARSYNGVKAVKNDIIVQK